MIGGTRVIRWDIRLIVALRLVALAGLLVSCAPHNPLAAKVPAHKMEEAKALKAPFGEAKSASPDIVAEGKKLFEGKGACIHCHGAGGKGDGPAGSQLYQHPAADFTSCTMHESRTDGELFWAMDHGVPGTAMVDMVHSGKLTELEAWKIVAYLRSLCAVK
ncbi:MAG: c-type cytochrome [Nitrospiraceae bacterium]